MILDYSQWLSRPTLRALDIELNISDHAEGERYTSGSLMLKKDMIEKGVKAIKEFEAVPYVTIEVANRDYHFVGLSFGNYKDVDDSPGVMVIEFTAEDLMRVADWAKRGGTLASY